MITKNNLSGRKCFRFIVFLSLTVFLFIACNKSEEPYRTIINNADTIACPVPVFPEVIKHVKRVLLEDYTGHICVNCPRAAVTARELKSEYGNKLVVMAVHAGGFAKAFASGDFTYDFQTPAGTAWDAQFSISAVGNPNGMVNRRKINNTFVISPGDWGSNISAMAAETPLLDIQVINEFTPDENKLCTHIQTQFLQSVDKNLKLIVALTEDSIVAPQKNNDPAVGVTPVIFDYVHMHVLRGTITSTWGSTIATIGTENPTSVINSYRYLLTDNIVPKNCRVVAFVYDVDTYEVLQAAEADLISK
jgi:hypothetical protein